ncbi:MAG TPA: hypothetical protein VG737_11590 [Cyclobacteriaceae bacterium]|nr:hypothetical protein [Cyclobacteriaceae bacterium]
MRTTLMCIVIGLLASGCSMQKLTRMQQASKSSAYQQFDFQALIRKYMEKDKPNHVEGIYSVSGSVTKKGKGFLGGAEKEKVTDLKENYAKVAIIRDGNDSGRQFIEISLDKEAMGGSYNIIGEFSLSTGGSILIYKHLEGKGKSSAFTFTTDESSDVLEGIRVENEGSTVVTYKLTYVKLSTR